MDGDWNHRAVAAKVGLRTWHIEYAEFLDMLPEPADKHSWSAAQVKQIQARRSEIVARVGTEHPLGADRCAERLANRLMIKIIGDDVRVLYEAGHLEVVGVYAPPDGDTDKALFALHQVDALPSDVVQSVMVDRLRGTAATLTEKEACAELGWPGGTFGIAVLMKRIQPNLVGRFTREGVAALAEDPEFRKVLDIIRPPRPDA